jgi:hypothetical protein
MINVCGRIIRDQVGPVVEHENKIRITHAGRDLLFFTFGRDPPDNAIGIPPVAECIGWAEVRNQQVAVAIRRGSKIGKQLCNLADRPCSTNISKCLVTGHKQAALAIE